MRASRPTVPALALAAVLSCLLFALATAGGPGEDRRPLSAAQPDAPEKKTLSAAIPARDARGEPIPRLPRYPGSVRVDYSEHGRDGLAVVRAAYLAEERPDAVRGFYRGVFRSRGWQVANVEYSGGSWHFLVLHGVREAGVEVLPRDGGSEVRVELSRPAGVAQESRASAGGSKR